MKTLENTILSWIYDLSRSNSDDDLFDKISILMTVFVLAAIFLNIIRPTPYGKTAVIPKRAIKYSIWSYHLSSKFVWRVGVCHSVFYLFLIVCPAFYHFFSKYGFIATIIVPFFMVFLTPCSKIGNFCNAAGLAIHWIHYFNR